MEGKNDATQIKRKGAPAPGTCPMGPAPIPTPTGTPTETVTLTPTGTATPCTGTPVANIVPSGGTKRAGSLLVDGSLSTDVCGRPLFYVWDCQDSLALQDPCPDFMSAAEDGTLTSYTFPLNNGDELFITLTVCIDGPNGPTAPCSGEVSREYAGQ
jgi:hypothetical protein